MFGLSFGHLIVLFVIVLVFGNKRLPELGAALGKGMRAFRKGLEGQADGQAENQIDDQNSSEEFLKNDHSNPKRKT
jgi:sec-independent protein translocase protein TatA